MAKDVWGKKSALCPAVTAKTQAETIPPTTPTNLSATQYNGTNAVYLYWGSSTDNSGVVYYEIYRNNVKIAMQAPAYLDSGLAYGTYQYKVRAVDPSGNVSGFSNVATVTVSSEGTDTSTATSTSSAVDTAVSTSVDTSTEVD